MIKGILQPLIYEPARHIHRFIMNEDYRTLSLMCAKLGKVPRFKECQAKIYNWNLSIPDSTSFVSAFKEIFVERIYAFRSDNPAPRILDLGANIGLSVLFFKKLYPKASITAFEADPRIFGYLEKNVHGNGYTDVELINKAAWHENTTLKFSSEGADGGRAAYAGDVNLIDVKATDINEFLKDHRFDFLKMDIEGAEESVLPSCGDYLKDFKYVFVEYHSRIERKQCLNELIRIISEAGFRIHLHSVVCSPSPFMEIRVNTGFDLQLNIFGWKE